MIKFDLNTTLKQIKSFLRVDPLLSNLHKKFQTHE